MPKKIEEMFEDRKVREKIKKRLPYLFRLAELESSRAGKNGMEVGSIRERIMVALLIHKFGEENVITEIPITEPEIDVELHDEPLSIKTLTSKGFGGVKLIWTVDPKKAEEFQENYSPACDILLIQINWDGLGGVFYIPLKAQEILFNKIGREKYIKLPKPGTNPRGVEISKEALSLLAEHPLAKSISIYWKKEEIDYDPYKRWVDYWREE